MNRESLFNTEKWLIDALKVIKYDEQTPRVFLVGTKNDLIVKNPNDLKARFLL